MFIVISLVPKTVKVGVTETYTHVTHVKTPGGATTVPKLVEIANQTSAFKTMAPVKHLVKKVFGVQCACLIAHILVAMHVNVILESALSVTQICGDCLVT